MSFRYTKMICSNCRLIAQVNQYDILRCQSNVVIAWDDENQVCASSIRTINHTLADFGQEPIDEDVLEAMAGLLT